MLSRRLFAAGAGAAAGSPAIFARTAPAPTRPEWTIDRIQRSKVLRVAALPGEAPYFNKEIATGQWSGMCVEMARDIAGVFDAKVEYLESTYGNSVLDLQADKIDLAFSLNPTPKRALVIDFTHPFYLHGFGMVGTEGVSRLDVGRAEQARSSDRRRYRLGARDRRPSLRAQCDDYRIEGARRLYPDGAVRPSRLRNTRSQSGADRGQKKSGARRVPNAS